MDELAPLGPVYQAGTLSGNPLATAAGLAVLRAARRRAPTTTLERDRRRGFADGLRDALAGADARAGARARSRSSACSSPPRRCTTTTTPGAPTTSATRAFFHGLLDRGVSSAPSGYETLFPSLAHTDADIDQTINAAAAGGVGLTVGARRYGPLRSHPRRRLRMRSMVATATQ
mgnify:CR=1 FL=1